MLQRPQYLCSLFLINSLPSAMLCFWKFFPNLCTDHDSDYRQHLP